MSGGGSGSGVDGGVFFVDYKCLAIVLRSFWIIN
jgi:hypothetical protein